MTREPEKHSRDIDPQGSLNFPGLTDLLGVTIARTVDAFNRAAPVSPTAGTYVVHLLNLFRSTHGSIALLIRSSDKDNLMYGDAVSLSREQVEKVFIICLLLDDPDKWAILYQKYAWMKLYEDFLLQTYECSELPRFEEFQTNIGPDILEKMRVECSVTLLEQEATKNRFDNRFYARNAPLPAHLADHVIPAFPTPGNARSQPKDSGVRRLLDRWFHQWRQLCDYSHVGDDKVLMAAILGRGSPVDDSRQRTFVERSVHPSLVISWVAAACACTEVGRMCLAQDTDLAASLTEFWTILEQRSLLGQLFWESRAKHLLPFLLDTA